MQHTNKSEGLAGRAKLLQEKFLETQESCNLQNFQKGNHRSGKVTQLALQLYNSTELDEQKNNERHKEQTQHCKELH